MDFIPVRKQSIADEITSQVLKMILQGAIKPGERLPPERELAVQFRTNRNTLREAIRNLQTLNLVVARQGDGLIVRDFWQDGELNLLPHVLQEIHEDSVRMEILRDMMTLRAVLLEEVVEALALAGTAEAFQRLRGLVQLQRDQAEDPEKRIRTDLDFNVAMVEGSGRPAYRWVFNTLSRLYRELIFQFPLLWVFAENYAETLSQVVELAAAGNGPAARLKLRQHLADGDKLVLASLQHVRELLD